MINDNHSQYTNRKLGFPHNFQNINDFPSLPEIEGLRHD